jgi:hypothetical protein
MSLVMHRVARTLQFDDLGLNRRHTRHRHRRLGPQCLLDALGRFFDAALLGERHCEPLLRHL